MHLAPAAQIALSERLDRAVASHLEQELTESRQRSEALISPLAALVESARELHDEQHQQIAASRAALDRLVRELSTLASGPRQPHRGA